MSGSSSSFPVSTSLTKHDVFLSFRGEDTRDNFISHLYAALQRKNIEAYIDYRLNRGEEISPALLSAIEESKIYVIVFSQDYASSTWCLNELTKILECKKRFGRDVIPVFYKVDPSTIRKQEQRYNEAFEKHEQHLKHDKVQGWKDALTEAAKLAGWDSKVTRPEHALVEEIVEDILRKLNRYSTSYDQGIIGIEKNIEGIQSLLHLESTDVRIIGICGMGGIGKTTICNQIYQKLAVQFDSSSLVLDVQEKIQRDGIDSIRRKYLSVLLKEEIKKSPDLSYYNERLKRTKAILILDDVTDSAILKKLIGGSGSFGQGSRIIMTSRDRQVLRNAGADDIYEVKELNFDDSHKLFSLHAFKQKSSAEKSYMDLSEKVLRYAKGIPLALQILGSLLYGRTREAWESELQKLKKGQHLGIFNVLKLSYDGLEEEEKNIFLDIACFYRGHEEIEVAERLDDFGFSSKIGMDILKDRGLISVIDGRIVMHDLIEEMGKEIVRKECPQHPGKRSRLFNAEEICEVLRKNKGSDAIECILLDTSKVKEVVVHAQSFEKMENLRMLVLHTPKYISDVSRKELDDLWTFLLYSTEYISNVSLESSLVGLPDTLKFLYWRDFPQRFWPPNFCPQNLVILEMPGCRLEQLWEGDQNLPNLKRLNLSHSLKLTRIPDLSLSPNIEELILSYCQKLIKVHSSIFLSKLSCLCLDHCYHLKSVNIPNKILSTSPGLIILSHCEELEMFSTSQPRYLHVKLEGQRPTFSSLLLGGTVKFHNAKGIFPTSSEISSISFDRYNEEEVGNNTIYSQCEVSTILEGVPSNFQNLKRLCHLDLSHCSSLTIFPFDLSDMKFLKQLSLRGCSKLENLPQIQDTLEDLVVLILDDTAIQALPSSLCRLVGLQQLSLCSCFNLEIIPSSIGSLTRLCKLDLTHCSSLQTFPSTIFNLKLRNLDLCGCSSLRTFPEITEPAPTFDHINLICTAVKELPSSFANLVNLRSLELRKCTDLESLPNSIVNLKLLSKLDCSGCARLTEIPRDIGRLTSLMELSLCDSGIVNLPESVAHLSSLKSLDLSDCKKLECIPEIPPFLKKLVALDCPSIRRVMSNSLVPNLSNSKEGFFKFLLTNAQQLDSGGRANIEEDARLRMTDDRYRCVFFCFPGSAVPGWFHFRGKGHSVTINEDLSFLSDDRLSGFALCVVFEVLDTKVVKDGMMKREVLIKITHWCGNLTWSP
ncbi:disease resistance protein RPV1-like isoform X2 [Phaseolus vulgaris]|uniref:disease resistance protein RPV1-like isoform X2 n=1 Tax=Phaseolus vulgaris TaxID=3885 RepID=UPI0035CB767B